MTKLGRRSSVSSLVTRLGMLCAALMFAFSVHAQIGATSSVSGQIFDASHAAVVGATVTLTDLSLKASKTAMSNDVGRYTFNDVQPGNYEISVAKEGFQTSRIAKQEVVVGIPVTLDFSLQVGATSLTVEVVSTSGAQLQTTNATTGDSLGGDTLLNLPAVARDASALIVFQPGVTANGNVAGQENDQNTFMVDGANNSQDMDGGNNTYLSGFGGQSERNGADTCRERGRIQSEYQRPDGGLLFLRRRAGTTCYQKGNQQLARVGLRFLSGRLS